MRGWGSKDLDFSERRNGEMGMGGWESEGRRERGREGCLDSVSEWSKGA